MDDMAIAYIKPRLLKWAMNRCSVSPEQIGTSQLTPENIQAWMDGKDLPTEIQAEALADKLRIPYLLLFMDSEPNIDNITIPDLRTIGSRSLDRPSLDFIDTLNEALLRQDWFRDYQEANGREKLSFVGKYSLADSPVLVAGDMRAALNFDKLFRDEAGDWPDLLSNLIRRAEEIGILIMRNGFVGHGSNRRLSTNEFRGFALSDDLAPVIFINDQDARAAQNFTIAHEMAHIWIGRSGISNVNINIGTANQNSIEQFCNQVAAEFLAPSRDFMRLWESDDSLWVNVRRACSAFKVSSLVVLLRALDNNLIQYPAFKSAFDREERKLVKEKEESDSGGMFWNTFPWKVSNLFGKTLLHAVEREHTTYTEAASLLGISVPTFETYLRQEGGT
jgi:Zn-dependent peptidase ImmA (M78 family)